MASSAVACVLGVAAVAVGAQLGTARRELLELQRASIASSVGGVGSRLNVRTMASPHMYATNKAFSTGVDDDGTALAVGAADSHWIFKGTGESLTVMAPNADWMEARGNSQWLSFNPEITDGADTVLPGSFIASTSFYTSSPHSSIVLTYGADNTIKDFRINGKKNSLCREGHIAYQQTCTMTVYDGLYAGAANTLEVTVVNTGYANSPSGFFVNAEEVVSDISSEFRMSGVDDQGRKLNKGAQDGHWFDMATFGNLKAVTPDAEWMTEESANWVSTPYEPEGDFVWGQIFNMPASDCNLLLSLATATPIHAFVLNGVEQKWSWDSRTHTAELSIGPDDGLSTGTNELLLKFAKGAATKAGLYVQSSTNCISADSVPIVQGGSVSGSILYQKFCVFEDGDGYYSCGGCDPNDYLKDFATVQGMLNQAIETCELDYLQRQSMDFCASQDVEDSLTRCKQYELGVYDDMYACTGEGMGQTDVPSFDVPCHVNCDNGASSEQELLNDHHPNLFGNIASGNSKFINKLTGHGHN